MRNNILRYRKQCGDIFGKPDFCFKGKKIKRNIERYKEVNKRLQNKGWKMIRFWEKEIEINTMQCIEKIRKIMGKR